MHFSVPQVENMQALRITLPKEAQTTATTEPMRDPLGYALVIADPDPLGVFGFAFATLLANLSTPGIGTFNAAWLSTGASWIGNAVAAWLISLEMTGVSFKLKQDADGHPGLGDAARIARSGRDGLYVECDLRTNLSAHRRLEPLKNAPKRV